MMIGNPSPKKNRFTEKVFSKKEGEIYSILANAPSIIMVVDRDGTIQFINRNVSNFSVEDTIGKKVSDFTSREYHKIEENSIKNAFDFGEIDSYEVKGIGPDGCEAWYETTVGPIKRRGKIVNVVMIATDITERKKSWDRLVKLEEDYRILAETSADGVITINTNGRLTYLNPSFEKMCNIKKSQILATPLTDYLSNDSALKLQNIFLNISKQNEKIENVELELISSDMGIVPVELNIAPLKKNNKFAGIECTVRDISERKKSENEIINKVKELELNELATLNIMEDFQETITALEKAENEVKEKNKELLRNAKYLQTANLELEIARKQLAELNRNLEVKVQERTAEVESLLEQKDEFISQLGHDLKTPLTPLYTLLPIARKRVKNQELRKLLDVTIHNVDYMKNLVIKTLQLAHLNSSGSQLEFENINLLEELKEIISNNQHIINEHKIKIENKVDNKIFVKADKLRLGELFENLISNAINYSIDDGKILIDAKKTKDFVKISIKDTGVGLTKDQINYIFNEFYKVDLSRHNLQSSGLGLSICKRIIEKHDGKIWVESPGIGKGSTFYFTLPAG